MDAVDGMTHARHGTQADSLLTASQNTAMVVAPFLDVVLPGISRWVATRNTPLSHTTAHERMQGVGSMDCSSPLLTRR